MLIFLSSTALFHMHDIVSCLNLWWFLWRCVRFSLSPCMHTNAQTKLISSPPHKTRCNFMNMSIVHTHHVWIVPFRDICVGLCMSILLVYTICVIREIYSILCTSQPNAENMERMSCVCVCERVCVVWIHMCVLYYSFCFMQSFIWVAVLLMHCMCSCVWCEKCNILVFR